MWSNISAPKSGLKAAQLGQHQLLQVKQENGGEQQHWDPPGKQQQPQSAANGAPLTRYKHAVCASSSSDGFIYIHGGRFGNGVSLDDDVWRFDPHANTWRQLQTSGCKPPSLQEHSLVEHRGQLYLFGGQVSAASGQENSFWRLDLTKREWFSLNLKSSMKYGAYLGPANRRGHSACVYRDSMYIFGGYEDFRGSTNQLWQYDLLNERWELRNLSSSSACHPEARHSHSAIVHGDSMFVYGGLSNLKPLGDLWRWSWRDKRWFRERTRGKSPGALHGHSAIQAFGSMFVFGGERQSGRTTRSLWRLNLSNLCWQKIKTKGPRPSPTTWHVAIANPMSVLDEANYLIEGGDLSDLEQQQQQRESPNDERLALLVNQQSASDNCFSLSSSMMSNGRDQQQTIPMETLRPRVESNVQRAPMRSMPMSHSKSSIEQMNKPAGGCVKVNNINQRDRTKAKRRLKLSFLRRNKKPPPPATCGSEPQKIPTSWSAVDIQASRGQAGPVVAASKRHSIEMPTDGALRNGADVEMSAEVDASSNNNAAILDSLDSDIKHLFERAMSPCDTLPTDNDNEDQQQVATTTNEANRNYTTNGTSLARDSMTQSQLSSWLTGVAGPATSTQTYQTAKEQLTSRSTLTITPTQLNGGHPKQEAPQVIARTTTTTTTSGRLADVRQRRSMQHFTSQQTRRGRPKSEIVQSLIDRADVIYADHHKTLNFKLDQPHTVQQAHVQRGTDIVADPLGVDRVEPPPPSGRFNSNDPLLGALANHRMFARQEAPSASKRPALDKSKRHTIHQTMTYYNLYFGQADHQAAGATARQLQRQPVSSDLTQSSSGSSAVTCRDATNGTQLSTSAALIGVRDGSAAGVSPSSGGSQQTGTSSRLVSMASSDSRTLCDGRDGRDLEEVTLNACNPDVMPIDDDGDHLYIGDHQQQQHSRLSDPPTINNDNTSLSFSMIAEFEEDDMLQYSSPTEPKMVPDKGDDDDHDDDDDDDDENEYDYYQRDNDEQYTNGHHRNEQSAIQATTEVATKQLIAQKSTSSGYDSIRSSCNDGVKQVVDVPSHHTEYSTSCSLDPQTANSSPGHNSNNRLQLGPQAVTVDSLHTATTGTTSTTTSGASPLSPPSKSLPSSPLEETSAATSSHKSSFASSLISGPSRLFGKKKTKTRYWQLCMFVLGGKQQSGAGHGNLNEPISIWRLYI